MAVLAHAGLRIDVAQGWDGRIRRRVGAAHATGQAGRIQAPEEGGAVAHLANFVLPAELGDFGGGATELMSAPHVLVNLVEYDESSRGTPLFAAQGMPVLAPADFDPATMQRTIEGQSGVQRFFSLGDRAFCLYVVLGSHRRRARTGPVVADAVRRIEIST